MFVKLFWLLEMRGDYAPIVMSHILIFSGGGGSKLFVTAVTRLNEKGVSQLKGCLDKDRAHKSVLGDLMEHADVVIRQCSTLEPCDDPSGKK